MRSLVSVTVIVVVIAIASSTARARVVLVPEAEVHFRLATQATDAGNYADALTELTAAYALDPQPELLFALGQVNRWLGRCADAIAAYEKFLASAPKPNAAAAASDAIETCREHLPRAAPARALTPSSSGTPMSATVTTPPAPAPQAPAPEPRPWYTDVTGDVLVMSGAASGILGLVVYRSAYEDIMRAKVAPSDRSYRALVDDASRKRAYAVALGGGGLALAAAGIVHYILRGRGGETASVAVAPMRGGASITWSGGF